MDSLWLKVAFAGLVAFVDAMLGQWGLAILVLALFLALDFLLGLTRAVMSDGLRGYRMKQGLVKILLYAVTLLVTALTDLYVQQVAPVAPPVFISLCMASLGVHEALSCLNHLMQMGVPIPDSIVRKLKDYHATFNDDNAKEK